MNNNKILQKIITFKDEKYKLFTSKLVPNINSDTIIGVKIPKLRMFAKALQKENVSDFLQNLPHDYLEENLLHSFLIENIKDYNLCIIETNRLLPHIDNWEVCDTLNPKCFIKNLDKLFNQIILWLNSNHTYTIRFAIRMLMKYFLDNNFKNEHLDIVANIKSDEYYIKMMIAWYFATALAKQYKNTIIYLENKNLDQWIHNKTIQKAIESFRITEEQKQYLKSLKIQFK